VYPLRVVRLGNARHDSGRLATHHMESVTASVAKFMIKGEEHRHQPLATYASSGGQQRRVEDKERKHSLPVIDRRAERRVVS
jgi:hypothetical protein